VPKFLEVAQFIDRQAELLGQKFNFQLQGCRKVELLGIVILVVKGSSNNSDFH